MNLLRIFLLALVDHLSLFQTTGTEHAQYLSVYFSSSSVGFTSVSFRQFSSSWKFSIFCQQYSQRILVSCDLLWRFSRTESKFLDGSNFQQDLRSYEIVAPQMQTQGRWRRDISTQSSSVSEPISNLRLYDFTALFFDILKIQLLFRFYLLTSQL